MAKKATTVETEAREYVWIPSQTWGGDHVVSDEEHAAACERAEEWLTDHEGDDLSITVRPARRGEALGTYERGPRGDLQILGASVSVPEDVESLIARAWDHAVSTWPAEDDGPEVLDYDSGDVLRGTASAELVAESRAAGDTGAVPAYRDDDGVWQYVRPDDVESERRRGREVRTVYVEAE